MKTVPDSQGMPNPNPYAAPRSEVADAPDQGKTAVLNRVASGQRLMIYSILVSMAGMALRPIMGDPATLISLAASVVAMLGVARLSGAMGSGMAMRVVYCLTMVLPLINLIVMLVLSARATGALRAGEYEVGLLGARQR